MMSVIHGYVHALKSGFAAGFASVETPRVAPDGSIAFTPEEWRQHSSDTFLAVAVFCFFSFWMGMSVGLGILYYAS